MSDPAAVAGATCPQCGTQVSSNLVVCPSCRRLLHSEKLKNLATEAQAALAEGRADDALSAWRQMLPWLPTDSRQYQAVVAKIEALSKQEDSTPLSAKDSNTDGNKKGKWGGLAGLGTIGLLLWKFKAVLAFMLTKGKILFLGLTKMPTLFSMLPTLGIYWSMWGWKFALGLVGSIYVHEMGHVTALRQRGMKATAPMFIPGFGAIIRLKEYPQTPSEDARVGLAGPIWGLGAAAIAYAVYLLTGWESWGAIARVGGWINLFNLIPVWQLDGSRGFHAMSRVQRILVALVAGGMWAIVQEPMLMFVAIIGLAVAFIKKATSTDWRAFAEYAVLVVVLGFLSAIPVGGAF